MSESAASSTGLTARGLTARGLTVRDRARVMVEGLDLDVAPGELVALEAASAADVSVLLAVLGGRRRPDGGEVSLDGVPLPVALREGGIGYLRSDHPLVNTLTAAENLVVRRVRGPSSPSTKDAPWARAETQLEAVGLAPATWHNLVEMLSGGQQQRVGVARALVDQPRLVVMEDPTSELDPDSGALVAQVLRRAADAGACCVVGTDDPVLLEACTAVVAVSESTYRPRRALV